MRSTERTVTIGIGDTPILGAAGDRVGIIFPCDFANGYTVTTLTTAVLASGINIPPNSQAIQLTARDHGELVKRAWRGIANVAPITVSVIEVFL